MSTAWKETTEKLLKLRGTVVLGSQEEEAVAYSKEELNDSLEEVRESIELAEGQSELWATQLTELKQLADECPTEWTEEELSEMAEDAKLLERLQKLREGMEVSSDRLKNIREEIEFLANESQVPQVAEVLEDELLERIKALRKSDTNHQIELEKVRKATAEIIEAVNQAEIEQLVQNTVELGKLFASATEDEEDEEVKLPELLTKPVATDPLEDPAFIEYRRVWAAFRPNLTFAERLNKYEISNEVENGIGQQILDGYAESDRLKEAGSYVEARTKLEELTLLVKNSRNQIEELKSAIALETEKKVDERQQAFTFTTKTKSGKFDTDFDSQNFYLANSVGELGTLKPSPKLEKMKLLLSEALEQANRLRALGALPEEIGRTAMKGIPKAFWPDWLIKEVEMFKRAHEKLQAELINEEVNAEEIDKFEKTLTTGEKIVGTAEKIHKVFDQLGIGKEGGREVAGEVIEELSSKLELLQSAYEIGKGLGGLLVDGEVIYDNPVKAKMVEFERNRAIIDIVNKMVSLGCDMLGEICPALGVVASGKDTLMEIFNAAVYFKRLHEIAKLKKGSKLDPRSAMLLPFCQVATEKKIQATSATINAITGALEFVGKVAELGAISAPVGVAVDKAAKVIKYAGKVIIAGCKWSEAEKAHKNLKLAIGPPPIRKAMLEVQKRSTKYARYILITGALDNDPWAVRYLESIGVEHTDLDNPNTTTDILREYITLTSGGLMGEQIDEEQQRFKESTVGKIAMAVKGGAEKIRDAFIGRKTSAPYDPTWKPPKYGLSRGDWQVVKKDAIQAGWYDNRLKLGDNLGNYENAKASYDPSTLEGTNGLYGALVELKSKVDEVWRTAKANDKTTDHAGMRTICSQWSSLIDIHISNVIKDRETLINKKYANLNEEEKKKAIDQELKEAAERQQELVRQARKNRKNAVTEVLLKTSFETPWGSFLFGKDLTKFTQKVKEKLALSENAARDFQGGLLNLCSSFADRLIDELEASPEEDLEKNLKLSMKQLVKDAYQFIRGIGEVAYDKSNPSSVEWKPNPSHFAFDAKVLQGMLDSAKKFAKGSNWDGSGDRGLKSAMKKFEKAQEKFDDYKTRFLMPPGDSKTEKSRPLYSHVDSKLGELMGSLEELETELRAFDPETDRQLPHNGLIAYQQEMLELVLVKRLELDAESEPLNEQRLSLTKN